MPKEMKAKSKKYAHLAVALGIVSAFISGHLWGALVERGVCADEMGTGGYMTIDEWFSICAVIVLIVLTFVFWIKSAGQA